VTNFTKAKKYFWR